MRSLVSMWLTPLATASRSTVSAVLRSLGGRTEHTGPGELHRAVAEAVHDAVTQGEGAGNTEISHGEAPMLNSQRSARPYWCRHTAADAMCLRCQWPTWPSL